jgi:crotonobetainyl-CoA:carnitine CoA-transferase CaiB-like acyl-CoA transferase
LPSFLDQFRGTGPLRDVTVLDFSQMLLGPLATQIIADLGGLVIKVEPPGRGEWSRQFSPSGRRIHGWSPTFVAFNRNKLSLTADLKSEVDRATILDLVPHADALVHNFRPGVMDRLGLGYAELASINPRLVYAAGSGYGPAGPMATHPGQDLLVQSFSGLAADSGARRSAPTPMSSPIVDASSGLLLGLLVVAGVMGARLDGVGRKIDVSLLGTALLLQSQETLLRLNTDLAWDRSDHGLASGWMSAPYGIYETSDGWIAIAMAPLERVAHVFELPDGLSGLDDEEWFEKRGEANQTIAEQVKRRGSDEWLEVLSAEGLWASPVLSLSDALAHSQTAANHYVASIPVDGSGSVLGIGAPWTDSTGDFSVRLQPPVLGEHNETIRRELQTLTLLDVPGAATFEQGLQEDEWPIARASRGAMGSSDDGT